ncbi:hypothetical protein TNCV_3104621 [Trichonephila clavipes]|nr:hypothetical protein TNCV_3104621 [Trichonephila clavipes]
MWESVRGAKSETRLPTHIVCPRFCHGFHPANGRETILLQDNILDRVLGARAAGVHYRLFSVWTLVPVRRDQQLSDHSTVDEIASGAADCRLTYTMANCPQRRLEKPGEKKREREKEGKRARKRQGLVVFRKRRGESQSFLLSDADEESETRMSKNALRTGRRQVVETATAGSDVVQSGRQFSMDFFRHLWPYIGNNTANVVFQMVKRLWLIRIDQ